MESVMNQDLQNFEYIVIDGDSIDGSKEIIKQNKEQINYYVSEPDSGIYNAMNKGIKIANGEYLLFLNSGDYLNDKNALFNFINHRNFKGDIIYGNYKFEKGEKIYPNQITPLHFFKSSLPHQSSIIKKKLFYDYGFYNEEYKVVSDKDFFLKCIISNKVLFSYINLFLSKIDLNGISNTDFKLVNKENEQMLKTNFGAFYNDYEKLQLLIKENKELKKITFKNIFFKLIKKVR